MCASFRTCGYDAETFCDEFALKLFDEAVTANCSTGVNSESQHLIGEFVVAVDVLNVVVFVERVKKFLHFFGVLVA